MTEKKFRILVEPDFECLVVSFKGKIEANDMFAVLEEIYSQNETVKNFPTIYDFYDSTAIGYRIELFSFIDQIKKLRKGMSAKKRIGIIVDSLNQKFLVKLFINLANGLGIDVEMFENKIACIQWMFPDENAQQLAAQMIERNRKSLLLQNSEK